MIVIYRFPITYGIIGHYKKVRNKNEEKITIIWNVISMFKKVKNIYLRKITMLEMRLLYQISTMID